MTCPMQGVTYCEHIYVFLDFLCEHDRMRLEVFNLPTWAELGRVEFSNLLVSLEIGAGSWELGA